MNKRRCALQSKHFCERQQAILNKFSFNINANEMAKGSIPCFGCIFNAPFPSDGGDDGAQIVARIARESNLFPITYLTNNSLTIIYSVFGPEVNAIAIKISIISPVVDGPLERLFTAK